MGCSYQFFGLVFICPQILRLLILSGWDPGSGGCHSGGSLLLFTHKFDDRWRDLSRSWMFQNIIHLLSVPVSTESRLVSSRRRFYRRLLLWRLLRRLLLQLSWHGWWWTAEISLHGQGCYLLLLSSDSTRLLCLKRRIPSLVLLISG